MILVASRPCSDDGYTDSGVTGFRAFRIFSEDGRVSGRLVEATLDELTPGDVVIQAAYSSVNYKDALAATGTGKILRRFPLVGGIDVAGTVESSADARFAPGDQVLVTGYDLGVAHDGGYAGSVRVPGDWVVPLPAGLSLLDAMACGTAGFTAEISRSQDCQARWRSRSMEKGGRAQYLGKRSSPARS